MLSFIIIDCSAKALYRPYIFLESTWKFLQKDHKVGHKEKKLQIVHKYTKRCIWEMQIKWETTLHALEWQKLDWYQMLVSKWNNRNNRITCSLFQRYSWLQENKNMFVKVLYENIYSGFSKTYCHKLKNSPYCHQNKMDKQILCSLNAKLLINTSFKNEFLILGKARKFANIYIEQMSNTIKGKI